jgi:hypothetical protein
MIPTGRKKELNDRLDAIIKKPKAKKKKRGADEEVRFPMRH